MIVIILNTCVLYYYDDRKHLEIFRVYVQEKSEEKSFWRIYYAFIVYVIPYRTSLIPVLCKY